MFLDRNNYPEEKRHLIDYLNKNYEYCYLDSMHYINSMQDTETIITGLSYGLDGLECEKMNDNTLNFCMHSQDLYYDFLHIRKAVTNSKSIKKCIITLGYYSLFYDLSLSSNKLRCMKIYYPLFSDAHHFEAKITRTGEFNSNNEYTRFCHDFFGCNPSYYVGGGMIRKNKPMVINKAWNEMTADERNYAAYSRATQHNRHMRHLNTYLENVTILNDMIKLLEEKGIKPIIVVLPFSEEYLRHINPMYKNVLLDVLEKIPYCVDFVDMNDLDIFTYNLFSDSDHLNDAGALLATELLNEFIMTL